MGSIRANITSVIELVSSAKTTLLSAASVQAVLLSASAVVGHFLLFLEHSEEVKASDAATTQLRKLLTEAIDLIDHAVRSLSKSVTDEAIVSEEQFLSIGKKLEEVSRFTDTQCRSVSKLISETAQLVEACAYSFGKKSHDTIDIGEAYSLGSGKHREELPLHLKEMSFRGIGVVPKDLAIWSDITTRSLSKALRDTFYTTDDLDGQASLDDDQEMSFVKSRSELLNLFEFFNRQVYYVRAYAESSKFDDQIISVFGKGVTEQPRFSDKVLRDASKRLLERVEVADNFAFALARTLSESGLISDSSFITPGKGLKERPVLADTLNRVFVKGATEVVRLLETTALSTQRSYSNEVSIDSSSSVNYGKHPTEAYALSDYFAEEYNLLGELFHVFDSTTLTLGPSPSDSIELSERYLRNLHKSIFDILIATDDLDGSASLDDDQEVSFMKTRNDLASMIDEIIVTLRFTREFSEALQLNDSTLLGQNKGLSDTVELLETTYTYLSKVLIQSATVVDQIGYALSRQVAHSYRVEDATHQALGKELSNVSTLFDLSLRSSHKNLSTDAATVSDLKIRHAGKSVNDFISWWDIASKNLLRPTADDLWVSALLSKTPNKARTDQAAFTDTGSLRSHNYGDFSYFAEDYVGASRTF
jgi:hypothetical protein